VRGLGRLCELLGVWGKPAVRVCRCPRRIGLCMVVSVLIACEFLKMYNDYILICISNKVNPIYTRHRITPYYQAYSSPPP
jgi:hypothetical protein